MIIWNRWSYRPNFLLLSLFLKLMPKYKGSLLRQYEQKYAELPEEEKLTKLCFNAGFSNTTIGPVFDVKVCCYQGRYGVEIMIESLFRDRTVSWVRIVNGINKYITETSEEIPVASVENRGAGKPVAKAKPRPMPTLTLSPVSIPLS